MASASDAAAPIETTEQRRARLDREVDAAVEQATRGRMLSGIWFAFLVFGALMLASGGAVIPGIALLLCGVVVFALDVRNQVQIREREEVKIRRAQPPEP